MWLWIAISLLAFITLWYWYSLRNVGKLEAQGVRSLKPYPFLGSHTAGFFMRKESMLELSLRVYKEVRDWDIGVMYVFGEPSLLINDPDLIREVTVKSFDHFMDRYMIKEINEVHEETDKVLTSISGEKWKAMRAALSPSFTTGKLKNLVGTLDLMAPEFNEYIKKEKTRTSSDVFGMKELYGRFTMGMIGRAVFGVDAKVFQDEDSEFVVKGKQLMGIPGLTIIFKFILYLIFPKFAKAMKIRFSPKEPWDFFYNITNTVIKQRRNNGTRANDMLQVLMDFRDKNVDIKEPGVENKDLFEKEAELNVKVDPQMIMTDDAICQSSVLFLLAGYDTTAKTLSMVTYYLAIYPDIQAKARDIVDEVAGRLGENGHLTYENMSDLEYLDMILSESNRMSPLNFNLDRMCNKDYTMSNGVKIEKGQRITIISVGLQTDEKYWKDPQIFDPDRFSRENKKNINPYTYLPFGVGPRNCIGMRFALLETKVALFHLLRNYILEPTRETPIPLVYDKTKFVPSVAGGNNLKLISRK